MRNLSASIKIVGCLFVLVFVFYSGTLFGFHKARVSYQWGEQYHRTFGGPKLGFFGDFGRDDFVNGHGVFGTIIRMDHTSLVIKGNEGMEKAVALAPDLTIKKGRSTISISDLKPDDRVVVIGTPQGDGTLLAKIIRLFDPLDTPLRRNNQNRFHK